MECIDHLLFGILLSLESKFKEVSKFGLPYMILARRFDAFFERYILVIYRTGGV